MKINEIYTNNETILRILGIRNDVLLVIDCRKMSMPYYVKKENIKNFLKITNEKLYEILEIRIAKSEELNGKQKKEINNTFNMISSVIPLVGDFISRKDMINDLSIRYNCSKETIRRKLCRYLSLGNKNCLLSSYHFKIKELSNDEKNFRWALNRFFYNQAKRSLHTTYLIMLQEKYSDEKGKLIDNYPPFHRFSYFYRKTLKKDNFIISREGKTQFYKDYSPLLGDSRKFFSSYNSCQLDSTILDIYLVDECNKLRGRPIMTTMVDSYSHMIMGYYLGFEGGTHSLQSLLDNVIENKVEHCKKYGIDIEEEDWPTLGLPSRMICDRGREYVGEQFSQITNLGVEIINQEPYRPDLKGAVERQFEEIQYYFKKELFNKGVIRENFQERGAEDYRKRACLTLEQFREIILYTIIFYNSMKLITLPYEYIEIKPTRSSLFLCHYQNKKDYFINVDKEHLFLTMLPKSNGRFTRNGLIFKGLRYRAYGFINDYLTGGEVVVSYNPNDVSHIYLNKDGDFFEFELIESFFENMSLDDAQNILNTRAENRKFYEQEELESEMALSGRIKAIVSRNNTDSINTKDSIKDQQKGRFEDVLKGDKNG